MRLRPILETIGALLIYAGGIGTMWYLEGRHIKKLESGINDNLLMLAAPLYECRAGRDWDSMAEWQERYPGCDYDCALHMLFLQAEAAGRETTVAER